MLRYLLMRLNRGIRAAGDFRCAHRTAIGADHQHIRGAGIRGCQVIEQHVDARAGQREAATCVIGTGKIVGNHQNGRFPWR
ncbi:hypothetical protein E05_02420 [Plautia stali symbiont]|nr:hypothetical protein E05_02420 [Plautia stali symbiont]